MTLRGEVGWGYFRRRYVFDVQPETAAECKVGLVGGG